MALDEEIEQFLTRPIPYEVPHEQRCHARAERHGAALGFLLSELAYLTDPDRPAPSKAHLANLVREAMAFGIRMEDEAIARAAALLRTLLAA